MLLILQLLFEGKNRSYFSLFQSVPMLKPSLSSRYWFCSVGLWGISRQRQCENQLNPAAWVVSSLGGCKEGDAMAVFRRWLTYPNILQQWKIYSLPQIIPWRLDAISEKPRAKTVGLVFPKLCRKATQSHGVLLRCACTHVNTHTQRVIDEKFICNPEVLCSDEGGEEEEIWKVLLWHRFFLCCSRGTKDALVLYKMVTVCARH